MQRRRVLGLAVGGCVGTLGGCLADDPTVDFLPR